MAVASTSYQAFAATPEGLGLTFVMEGQDCRYRLSLTTVERSAQIPVGDTLLTVRTSGTPKRQKKAIVEVMKRQRQRQINTAFAVVLDVDAYLQDPADVDLRGFVQSQAGTSVEKFRQALPKDSPKKGK